MDRVLVVGGGASGMMAAVQAATVGASVVLLEKMRHLGTKLRITGKGRCNLTNQGDIDDFMENYGTGGRFLHNAFARFFNDDLISFFHDRGVALVVERGRRVFPASGDADDVIRCLEDELRRKNVQVERGWPVAQIRLKDGRVAGVESMDEIKLDAGAVIVATGGLSYPGTGSTGDGYQWARSAGHSVTELRPALVPLETDLAEVRELIGLSLKNVRVTALAGGKAFREIFGEMLFTHTGLSGPIILAISKEVGDRLKKKESVMVSINFKPALSVLQVDRRLQREFSANGAMQVRTVLRKLVPAAVADRFVRRAHLSGTVRAADLSRSKRADLVTLLTDYRIKVEALRPIAEAIVTAGGVDLREIDPRTMESRLVHGLYFCGEVLDLDGMTGGYNLQAAFTTGFLAGDSASRQAGYPT